MLKLLLSALKFGAVGLLGMAIDFFFTWLCKEKLKINKFIANAIGFSMAVINNYILNRIWTFSSKNPQIFEQFLYFLGISSIGLALNSSFLYLFHNKFKLNFYFQQAPSHSYRFFMEFLR